MESRSGKRASHGVQSRCYWIDSDRSWSFDFLVSKSSNRSALHCRLWWTVARLLAQIRSFSSSSIVEAQILRILKTRRARTLSSGARYSRVILMGGSIANARLTRLFEMREQSLSVLSSSPPRVVTEVKPWAPTVDKSLLAFTSLCTSGNTYIPRPIYMI